MLSNKEEKFNHTTTKNLNDTKRDIFLEEDILKDTWRAAKQHQSGIAGTGFFL